MLDFAVFVLFLILLENSGKDARLLNAKKIIPLLAAGIGFFLPFALINLYYLYRGNYDALVNVIYMAPQRYPNPINAIKMPLFILDFQLRFFPIFLFFYYSVFEKSLRIEGSRPVKAMLILWSVAALMAVIISGNHYGHYTIQLMLPVSLMAGLFFHEDMVLPAYLRWITLRRTGLIALPLLVLGISALKLEYVVRRDVPREIAAYLKPRLKESDIIYTGNYHHILYYLLKKDSPTPYVHRSVLLDSRHLNALNIDQQAEFEKIMRKDPAYILTQKEFPAGTMKDFITSYYMIDKDFGNTILLWKKK
jgi:hypothetical protein